MSDLIRRSDAIEALGECPENWTDTSAEIQEVRDWEYHKACIEAVDAVDAVSEWIPCEVALPSESGRYLVTIADVFGDTEMCVIWFAHEEDYYSDYSEWREITDDVTVIAWMPLPKPYGERSDT